MYFWVSESGVSCQNWPSLQGHFHQQPCDLKKSGRKLVRFSVFSMFFQYKNDLNNPPADHTQWYSPTRLFLPPMHPPHAIHSCIHHIHHYHKMPWNTTNPPTIECSCVLYHLWITHLPSPSAHHCCCCHEQHHRHQPTTTMKHHETPPPWTAATPTMNTMCTCQMGPSGQVGISYQSRPSPQGQFHWQFCNSPKLKAKIAFSCFFTFSPVCTPR